MRIKKIQSDSDRHRNIYYEYDMDSRPLGEGGMGVVYRGVKVNERLGIKTDVAIKVLNEGMPDEVYARAEREASIQIRHTNLIEMYGLISEYEVDRFGTSHTHHYLISELLHGVDLSDLLSGKFDNSDGTENEFAKSLYTRYLRNRKETSIEIIRNISSGVLALHDAGYIHRDIDPSNVMVTDDGNIKLIDFGIAKNVSSLDTKDRLTTSTGKFIGKAEYASPELVLGDIKNHNYTTDIYALGILLFRLLTGKLPFAGTQYEVLQKQLKSKTPVRLIEDVAIAKVVKKATEKNQSSRYATVAEFRVAVDYAARHHGKRIPTWVYGSVASLAILLCGYGIWRAIPSKPEADEVLAEAQDVRFNNALALLNSDSKESVKEGFEQMKLLASEGYEDANMEIGVTYFPYLDAQSLQDTLSNPILKRRYYLNLTSENDADSVIRYLNKPANLPPEASFMLGIATYNKTEDVDSAEDKALTLLRQAKYSIERNHAVGHGYSKDELKRYVEKNIQRLNNTE